MNQIGPIPVRFSPELISRLEKAAETTGLGNKSAVIKLCVKNFLDFLDEHGPEGLGVNWRELLRQTDGRVTRFQNIKVNAHQSVVNGVVINNHLSSSQKREGKSKPKKKA